jgi:hypothetical protein
MVKQAKLYSTSVSIETNYIRDQPDGSDQMLSWQILFLLRLKLLNHDLRLVKGLNIAGCRVIYDEDNNHPGIFCTRQKEDQHVQNHLLS